VTKVGQNRKQSKQGVVVCGVDIALKAEVRIYRDRQTAKIKLRSDRPPARNHDLHWSQLMDLGGWRLAGQAGIARF
jgi:deoxycytidine triphosphate deaminase